MKYSDVNVKPLPNYRFEVIEDIYFKDIVIPKGYITNGADIPRVFWSIYPPNKSDYLPAVIIHDYLCEVREYEKANQYFDEALRCLEVNKLDVFILVASVKIYRKFKNLILKGKKWI